MNRDVLSGLIFAGVAAYFYIVATGFPINSQGYPKAISGILLALAIVLVISGLRRARGGLDKIRYSRTSLAVIFTTAVYIILLPIIGYVVSTAIYLFVCFLVTGMKRRVFAILLSVVSAVGLFWVFNSIFDVRLPSPFLRLF